MIITDDKNELNAKAVCVSSNTTSAGPGGTLSLTTNTDGQAEWLYTPYPDNYSNTAQSTNKSYILTRGEPKVKPVASYICGHCSNPIHRQDKYCSQCGTKIDWEN